MFFDTLNEEIEKMRNTQMIEITGDLNRAVGKRMNVSTVEQFREESLNNKG